MLNLSGVFLITSGNLYIIVIIHTQLISTLVLEENYFGFLRKCSST